MYNFDTYLKNLIDKGSILKQYSQATYNDEINQSSVLFSFNTNNIINEVCFARLFTQMPENVVSRNYIMRLPYLHSDIDNKLHKYIVDYPIFFENLSNLVIDLYKIEVNSTPYVNIKIVTVENKIPIIKSLDYCITLILFTLMRGVEGEYNSKLKNYKITISGDLREYVYTISKNSRGSHHNINDTLDQIIQKNDESIEKLKKLVSNKYIDILEQTFSKNGLINNEEYQPAFAKIFIQKPDGYGWVMQTGAFDFIQQTTNKFLLEE